MTLINLGETPGDGTGDSRRYAGQKINALLPLIVKSVSVTTPPSSPQENDRYIIPANAAGDWANRENKIAAWQPVVWENDAWNHDGGWLYVTPEEGLPASDVNGSVLYKFLGGTWVVYDPQDAVTAAEAARDAAIAASENLAWGYTFDSGVTDSDPGTGKFRFDNATFMSATFLYISQTADEGDISSVIDSWDDSTSSNKATIKVRDPISPSNWLEAAVTGNSVDAGNYWKIPITPVAISGSIVNGLSVLLGAVRHGDAGSGSVDSFNGRTGLIESADNDYDSDKIGNTSDVIGSTVTEALNSLNSGLVQVGIKARWDKATPPIGWLICDGSTFDQLVYPDLYTHLGTNVLPDHRNRVSRDPGPDTGPLGSTQEDDFKTHQHIETSIANPGAANGYDPLFGVGPTAADTGATDEQPTADFGSAEGDELHSLTSSVGGTETRVKAIIDYTIIKAHSGYVNQTNVDLSVMEQSINASVRNEPQTFGDGGAQVRSNIGAEVNLGELHTQDRRLSGTHGGANTGGQALVRTLNTVVKNTITDATVINDIIYLPVGTYKIKAEAVVCQVNNHQLRLFNTDDGEYILEGLALRDVDADTGSSRGFLDDEFTLTSPKNLTLRHFTQTTRATVGFGYATGVGNEVYADVKIKKVA